jgi:hypothetical protein
VNRQDFERAFAELKGALRSRADNQGCIECGACERCTECTFCQRSNQLVRCHYCVESERCIDCTHCHAAVDLMGCSHCVRSQRCSRSAYLERCIDCTDCRYCFGCVGLSGREFSILNEPYDRATYFKLTAELARTLGNAPL